MGDHCQLDPEIAAHYTSVSEQQRLGPLSLERVRTWELLGRHLPPPPAVLLDIGGAAGVYALRLAAQGYQVRLVDPVALHVQQALHASAEQPATPLASASVGDSRQLDWPDASVDGALLLGPLYHLTDRADRINALTEAGRVLRPGGVLVAAAISRFASTLDGLLRGYLDEPGFEAIVERDVRDGQHRNPTGRPEWFTTAFFHLPEESRPGDRRGWPGAGCPAGGRGTGLAAARHRAAACRPAPARAGPCRHPPSRDRAEPARGKLPPAGRRLGYEVG